MDKGLGHGSPQAGYYLLRSPATEGMECRVSAPLLFLCSVSDTSSDDPGWL